MDTMEMDSLSVPPGVNPLAAKYLWNTLYQNDPAVSTMSDMVAQLGGPEGVMMEYNKWANPDQVEDAVQPAQTMQNATDQLNQVLQETKPSNIKISKKESKMITPFNLKRAQEAMLPLDPMGMNDTPEMMGDQRGMIDDVGERKFSNGADVEAWLTGEVDLRGAQQYIAQHDDGSGMADTSKELVESFYSMVSDPMAHPRDREKIAGQIFDTLPGSLKAEEDSGIPAQLSGFGEVENILKKIAKRTANKNKKKKFNLKKTAQHKTLQNTIMWGPGEKRKNDPFLHQPVSDWHIVERNKGFGLVVDDVWNIDYETIWRENVMDKYYRSYRDASGNWVGGYIQKRFEVDKNIPETSNYQLKPGQLRKPILPEYGNLESRLQTARSKGDIPGSPFVDKTKPFNWKEAEAKKKKLINAQLKDIRELGLKPLKYPGDPDPVQPITTCKWCGSALNEKEKLCHNCGRTQIHKGNPYPRKVPDRGESPSPFGTNKDVFVNPAISAQSKDSIKRKKKDPDNAEEDEKTVKDVFVSDSFQQCSDPKRLMHHFVDRKEEVMKSCRDLEIDG